MHNRPELWNFQLEQPTTADNCEPAARPPSRLSCRSRHERVRGKPSASLLRCLRPFKAATQGFADGRQRGLSPAPEFSKQEARGPWKGGPRTLSNRGASGRGGLILSRGKATNSFSSQRGRESESFTGRSPFSPGTCLQGKALGALRCAGGTDSKGTRTPTALGRDLARAARAADLRAHLPRGALSARGGPALLLPPALRPLARVGSAAGRLGSASRGAPGAESGARAAPGRSLGSRRARTHTLCGAHLGVHCLHPENTSPESCSPHRGPAGWLLLFLKKVLMALRS